MALFGRMTARRRLRKAVRASLAIPLFSSGSDCTPWVIGGLWPAELSTPTDETLALASDLRADLQRIVAHANDALRQLGHSTLDDASRCARQAGIVEQARSRAVRRVEATLRQINTSIGAAATADSPPQGAIGPHAPVHQAATSTPTPNRNSGGTTDRPRQGAASVGGAVAAPGTPATEADDRESGSSFATKPPLPQTQWSPVEHTTPSQPASEATDVISIDTKVASTPSPITSADPPRCGPDESAIAAARQDITSPAPHRFRPEGAIHVRSGLETREPGNSRAYDEETAERLQRLRDFMVRQEPRLSWAVGQDADSVPLLVTDLATGWIPAGVALPAGVRLLEPASRSGDLSALLGEAACVATYVPGDDTSAAGDGVDSFSTQPSGRSMQLPMVDSLDWELSRATQWRDGLPPIVHTMITATARGFGVVDDEVALLQDRLGSLREQALDQYPHVDRDLVRNWALLAAAVAYIFGDAIAANYHFAWSQAL